jgi:hypothetical protein
MKLIGDIINDLVDSEKSLSAPLLKTKVLATRLKNTELLTWIKNELEGYISDENLPSYRKMRGNITGSYINGNMQVNDQPLPIIGFDRKITTAIYAMNFKDSIATLEALKGEEKTSSIGANFPPEIAINIQRNIQKSGNPYFQLIHARRSLPVNVITQILSVVRSQLLDFMLKIDEEFGNLTEIEDLKKEKGKINNIMNQTIITGNGNLVNTGDNSNIKNEVTVKLADKESLKTKLQEEGVQEEDISELIQIIDQDIPKDSKLYGSKVNVWVQKMISKALDGSWQVGIGAAGTILAEALQSYYGIK